MIDDIIPTFIFVYFADPAHPYTIEEITLETDDHVMIQALIFTPKNISRNHLEIVNEIKF